MEAFSEDHSKLLLSKEWLVKVGTDGQNSTPYLMKFYSSTVDLQCLILISDTKSVWTEVLSSNQFARRWRQCNHLDIAPFHDVEKEEEWRTSNMEVLSQAHTLGAIADISFEVVESNFSDFAFHLECETFKWNWETCFLGHRLSADLISKHLIAPLITLNHLAFSSADPVSEMSDIDVERAIDKIGRTARRTLDTHIRNAISKPRVATSLSRISAMFNFVPELPSIRSAVERPELQASSSMTTRSPHPISAPSSSSPNVPMQERKALTPEPSRGTSKPLPSAKTLAKAEPDSATESEQEDVDVISQDKPNVSESSPTKPTQVSPPPRGSSMEPRDRGHSKLSQKSSDSDSSPIRTAKKPRRDASSSDEDSEEERKRRVAQIKSGAAKRGGGTRQPIKRGGKRF